MKVVDQGWPNLCDLYIRYCNKSIDCVKPVTNPCRLLIKDGLLYDWLLFKDGLLYATYISWSTSFKKRLIHTRKLTGAHWVTSIMLPLIYRCQYTSLPGYLFNIYLLFLYLFSCYLFFILYFCPLYLFFLISVFFLSLHPANPFPPIPSHPFNNHFIHTLIVSL